MAKTNSARQEFLFTLPEPRDIQPTGGLADLSEDVRLVTSNVAPLYRKTMRTVLASAGIRVVANKKKFIIDVRVEPAETLSMKDVPAAAREEYYEIDVLDNAVTVRTGTQLGALWGTHTLAGIYKAKARGISIPNMKMRDWPDYTLRGGFVGSLWGMERLLPEEWNFFFERLAAVKLNAVALPLDGGRCPACQEAFGQGVLTPLPEFPEAQKDVVLSWYSPGLKSWRTETFPSRFHGENTLTQILGLARENGLTPIPAYSLLGDRTALPRLLPEISARSASNAVLGQGFCLSAPATRTVLQAMYGETLTRFFPGDHTPYVMFHLSKVDLKAGASGCQCPKCRKKSGAALVQEHLVWLLQLLGTKGVQHVIVRADADAAESDALFSADFAKQIQKLKNVPALILMQANGATKKKSGALPWDLWGQPELPATSWVFGPGIGKEVSKVLPEGFKAGQRGVLFETVWDTSCLEPVSHFANFAWRAQAPLPELQPLSEIITLHLSDDSPAFIETLGELQPFTAADSPLGRFASAPAFAALAVARTDGSYDFNPLFQALSGTKNRITREQLQEFAHATVNCMQNLTSLLDREQKPPEVEMVRALMCESARLSAIANTLLCLVDLHETLGKKRVDAKSIQACDACATAIVEALTIIETRRNKLTAPLKLAELSPLYGLVDQVAKALRGMSGKAPNAELPLTWAPPPPPV